MGSDALKVMGIVGIRSGSKGVSYKNIRQLAGKPLGGWILDAARRSKYINRLIVSTDSPSYSEIAKAFGAEVPFIRPGELTSDQATEFGYVMHLVDWLEKNEGYRPDIVVRMKATVPLRSTEDIDAVIAKLVEDPKASSAVV